MKIITISKKKFESLTPLDLPIVILNTEGELYNFNYRGEEKILKRLFVLEGKIFANKLYTLQMLDTYKKYLPTNFCIPDYLCSIGGTISAFTTPKIDGTNLSIILNSSNVDYKEQIFYLKQIGEILQQLQHIRNYTPLTNIYLCDLHEGNFVVDDYSKELKVVDLDSCKIGTNDTSASKYLTGSSLVESCSKYIVDSECGCVVADGNSDLFCYCMVILNYLLRKNVKNLSLEKFYTLLNHLDVIGIDKELIDIFYKLTFGCENKNPLNYLESISEKQIIKLRMYAKTTL